jgi:N-acetylmuramoyl-L-alanine amidase
MDSNTQKKKYQKSGLLKKQSGLKKRELTKFLFIASSQTPTNLDVTKEQIDAMHRKNGLLGIGFHYVITIDGDVKKGRETDQIGFDLKHNDETIGILLIGNTEFNELQLKALKILKTELTSKYGHLKIMTTLENIL